MKIRLSKSQWEDIGIKNNWVIKEAQLMSSLPSEIEKELRKIAKKYFDNEIGWGKASTLVLQLTANESPEVKQFAIERFQEIISILSQKSRNASSKKIVRTAEEKMVFDMSTKESFDLDNLTFSELEDMQNWGDFDEQDLAKIQNEILSKRTNKDDMLFDAMKDNNV